MNAQQRKPAGRLADLSPFDIQVGVEPPMPALRIRNAVCREFLGGRVEIGADCGCVDWFQYPAGRADADRAL